jgi:3-methyladenine DNA glycosylase AlkD
MDIKQIKADIARHGSRKKAKILQSFFKTGPGEYAEGDVFVGVQVPVLRKLAGKFAAAPVSSAVKLLRSPVHEERFLALVMLMDKYRKSDASGKEEIYRIYLDHTRYINNWDLVDVTAKNIVGDYLRDRDKKPLYALAGSKSLWERRIAVLSTFYFIGKGQFGDSLNIARILLRDEHDLIHKAVGWMLREIGKRDQPAEEAFLNDHYRRMPSTMLRYAIERFPERKRRYYLRRGRK